MSDVRGNIGNSETMILCQMLEGTQGTEKQRSYVRCEREQREQRNNDLMSDVRGNIGNSETRILCQMLEGTQGTEKQGSYVRCQREHREQRNLCKLNLLWNNATFVFRIDSCLVYTCRLNEQGFPTLGVYFKFGLYRIPVLFSVRFRQVLTQQTNKFLSD